MHVMTKEEFVDKCLKDKRRKEKKKESEFYAYRYELFRRIHKRLNYKVKYF